ncbi:MAG: hypothetical protein EBU34_04620 [Alphaproteobacteria bacterium]|nr:hypothetical protein [Alphaproteobacteria bacterium]
MPCSKCRQDGHNARTCKTGVVVEETVKQQKQKRYYCYILGQTRHVRTGVGRTYNGYTVDLTHRLRQHNGEIKGGAFATKNKGPWEFIAVMTCLDWTSVRAMQVEWLIRYPTRKKPRPTEYAGAQGRIKIIITLFGCHQTGTRHLANSFKPCRMRAEVSAPSPNDFTAAAIAVMACACG